MYYVLFVEALLQIFQTSWNLIELLFSHWFIHLDAIVVITIWEYSDGGFLWPWTWFIDYFF